MVRVETSVRWYQSLIVAKYFNKTGNVTPVDSLIHVVVVVVFILRKHGN